MFPSYKSSPRLPSEHRGMLPSFEQLGRRYEPRHREKIVRGGGCLRVIGYLALVVILIVVAIVGAEAYGYSQLQTSFQAQQCSPILNTLSFQSILSTIYSIVKGDLIGLISSIVTGLNVQGVITLNNPSFVPLYIPTMNHKVTIDGKECQNIVQTEAMWIAPYSDKSQAFSLQVSLGDLPGIALSTLANGGAIEITIVSEIPLGSFSITKTTLVQTSISQPLSSYVK